MKRVSLIAAGLALVLGATVAHAANLKVPADYPDIQAAVDAAGAGDTIVVSKGIHKGPVLIEGKTDLTIKGKGKAVLDGESTDVALTIRDGKGVTVTKITIVNTGSDAVLIEGGYDIGISKVKILDPSGCAVLVVGARGVRIEKCVIESPG